MLYRVWVVCGEKTAVPESCLLRQQTTRQENPEATVDVTALILKMMKVVEFKVKELGIIFFTPPKNQGNLESPFKFILSRFQ